MISRIDVGMIKIRSQQIEMLPGIFRRDLVGAEWEGPPIVSIGERLIEELPDWAVTHDRRMILLGPYVLRRTAYQYWGRDWYWVRVTDGELYWLYWRLMHWLAFVGGRIVLTLAVWNLAKWPVEGSCPTWRDVVRRWRK